MKKPVPTRTLLQQYHQLTGIAAGYRLLGKKDRETYFINRMRKLAMLLTVRGIELP